MGNNKNIKHGNIEDELIKAPGALLRDYIALSASEEIQTKFIPQSKQIMELFKRKKQK